MRPPPTARPAVLLDRDGVINTLVSRRPGGPGESPLRPEQVTLAAGVAGGLRLLREAGFATAIVTNQPAAAKGEADLADVVAVQAEVDRLLAQAGVPVRAVHFCLHHPLGRPGHPLTLRCDCRKPAPGLLVAALEGLQADARTSWIVGDSDRDIAAGRAAGVSTVLVESPLGGHRRTGRPAPDLRAADLHGAARLILERARAGSAATGRLRFRRSRPGAGRGPRPD